MLFVGQSYAECSVESGSLGAVRHGEEADQTAGVGNRSSDIDLGQGADAVTRLGAYRGIDRLAALTLASEVCEWRRFSSAGGFMSFCGLVPSEYSSGDRTRRGHLTRAGNLHVRTQLVESAWAYNHPARLTKDIARRHEGVGADTLARAWTAQQRLCRRFRVLDERKNVRSVVNAAIARELAGFVWAEMTA